jgi:hypothetical protein
MVPLLLAWLGDYAGAAEKLRGLPADSPAREITEAFIALRAGDREAGRSRLRALSRTAELEHRAVAWSALLADAEAAGRDRDVIEAAAALRLLPGNLWRSWAYPRSVIAAARAYERVGERTRARASLDRLIQAWHAADPDLPGLAEAKELRHKLGEGS